MFIGHYGPSFAIKAYWPSIPLWLLFIAVQLVDVGWATLVLLDIEKVRIVPGITASNPLDLYYMPYTHSLLAAIAWSAAAALLYRYSGSMSGWLPGMLVGAAVFSHWILDLIVHRPDLAIYDDTIKVGLGLWNFPVIASVLEVAVLLGGMALYLRKTKAKNAVGRFGFPVFGIAMIAIQASVFFGPPPTSPNAAAITALVAYFVFALVANLIDRQREYIST